MMKEILAMDATERRETFIRRIVIAVLSGSKKYDHLLVITL